MVGEGEHDSLDEGVGDLVVVGLGEYIGTEVIEGGTEVVDGMHVRVICCDLGFDRFIGESCMNEVGIARALEWGGER